MKTLPIKAPNDPLPSLAVAPGSAIATLQRTIVPPSGRCFVEPYEVPVRVLAVAEGYAMVRRKGCSPFVLEAKRVRNVLKPNDALCRPAGDAGERKTTNRNHYEQRT